MTPAALVVPVVVLVAGLLGMFATGHVVDRTIGGAWLFVGAAILGAGAAWLAIRRFTPDDVVLDERQRRAAARASSSSARPSSRAVPPPW